MAFYYTREPGPEGQILAADGASPGRPLRRLLLAGPLPVKVALELVAYCADILTIAEEDGMVHGLLTPDQITLDERGAVSLNGWGVAHPECVAPELRPAGPATDVYGLGIVLHGVLADQPMGDIPTDRDGHDDAIVTRLTELDWQELAAKRWMDEVLHFLCSMLAHDPVERPVALDVANVLGQVSAQVPGDELVPWAMRTLSLAPEEVPSPPVFEQHAAPQGVVEDEEEDLGGPEALGSPVSATSAFKLRKAASAKGEATAFWSRERIAELLADEDDEDEPVRERFDPSRAQRAPAADVPLPDATISGMPAVLPEHQPAPAPAPPTMPLTGGGSSFDAPDPPPFVRPTDQPAPEPPQPAALQPPLHSAPVAPQPHSQQPYSQQPHSQQPYSQQPVAQGMSAAQPPQPPAAQPPAQPGWQPPERSQAPPDQGGGPRIQGPQAPPPGEPAKSGPNLKLVIGLLVGFILLCGGVTVVGGVGMYFWRQDATSEAPAPERPERPETVDAGTDGADAPADAAGGTADPEPPAADPEPAKASTKTKPASSSAGSSSAGSGARSGTTSSGSTSRSGSSGSTSRSGSSGSSSRSGSSGSTSRSGSSGSSPRSGSSGSTARSGSSGSSGSAGTPDTTAGGGLPARIRFVHEGPETTLECSPGGRRSFTGSTTFDIDTVTTCRVRLEDGAMTALQLRSGGTVTCTSTPGVIRCSGP